MNTVVHGAPFWIWHGAPKGLNPALQYFRFNVNHLGLNTAAHAGQQLELTTKELQILADKVYIGISSVSCIQTFKVYLQVDVGHFGFVNSARV